MGLIKAIFGSYSEREVKRIRPIVEKINSLEEEMEKLSDKELTAKEREQHLDNMIIIALESSLKI